jgi:hypothetical protein
MKYDRNLCDRLPSILAFALGFVPLVVWFVYQTHLYAGQVKLGVPPDELHHYNLALFYKETPGIFLTASEKTYPYGPVDYHPYLYHLLIGKLLLLNPLSVREDLILRHVSILCSVGTLCALWALLEELKVRSVGKVVAIAAITNITMFVFVSSAISYDGFVNLLAVLLQLYFIRALRDPTWTNALMCSICLLAGSLAKVTFLPFYLIVALTIAIFYRPFFGAVKSVWHQKLRSKDIMLALVAGILLVGNIHLYGGNYLKFRAIIPAFEQVVGEEVATTAYAQARRDKYLIQTKDSRADMSLGEFVPKYFESALWSIYGIMGHKSFYREQVEMDRFYLTALPTVIGSVVFLILLMLGREQSPHDVKRALLIVTLFGSLYIAVVCLDNFKSFQLVRVFGYGLQGRYLFPVLSNILVVCAFFSFYRMKSWKFALPLAVVIAGVFLKQGPWSIAERLKQIGFF